MADKEVRRIERHLFRVARKMVNGQWGVYFLGRFQCWNGERFERKLSIDLQTARGLLRRYELLNDQRKWPLLLEEEVAALERKRQEQERRDAMTISKFAAIYKDLTKGKRSRDRDEQHLKHICRLKGEKLLSDISRADLIEYRDQRLSETIYRCNKWTKVRVSPGTVRNELSCWRHLINVAIRERDSLAQRGVKYEVASVSFEGVMPDATHRQRVLKDSERERLLKEAPLWLRRLLIVALETSLSRGDLLRLRWEEIDFETGTITPTGGRIKTGIEQVAPLTDTVRKILSDIKRERKKSVVSNIETVQLVFVREDGAEITADTLDKAMQRACRAAVVKDFRFHDTRHTAKTEWARAGIGVEAAMKAAGHASVQMHAAYIHLQRSDIAKAFGTVVEPLRNEAKGSSKRR